MHLFFAISRLPWLWASILFLYYPTFFSPPCDRPTQILDRQRDAIDFQYGEALQQYSCFPALHVERKKVIERMVKVFYSGVSASLPVDLNAANSRPEG